MREEIIEPNIKYSRIGESRRIKLIDLVIRQGYKTVRASKMLKINQSTAKSILKLYRETGTYSIKSKHDQEAVNKQRNTQTKEKTQQQTIINGNTQNEQNSQLFSRVEPFNANLYQTPFCMYPTYFPQLYIMFPNTERKE